MIMSHYLPVVAPDYSASALEVTPHEVLVHEGAFDQIQYKTHGGAVKTITLNGTPELYVTLTWNRIPAADLATLMDFFFDASKGFGLARTFPWIHPEEQTEYTVQFTKGVSDSLYAAGYSSVSGITLRVWGTTA